MPARIARVGSVLLWEAVNKRPLRPGGRNVQSVSMIRSLRFGGVGPAGLLGLRLLGSVSTVSFLRGPTDKGRLVLEAKIVWLFAFVVLYWVYAPTWVCSNGGEERMG